MRLILTRHYKTQTNEEDRILGWGDSPPGSDWKADIDYVDDRLREQDLKFDAIFSSDLERSRQTAIIHAVRFGIPMVNSTSELNEVNYGQLQTQKKDAVAKNYPQHKVNPDMIYPGGESFRQMQQRSIRFMLSLAASRPQQTVLIVAHAGVIRGMVSHYLGLEYARHLKHRISFRYIGDFQFEGNHCLRYDELGQPSGFVDDGIIEIPFINPSVAS
ncbi:MAG: histidine phosphatase family protein [Gammaproteobacteria bacterium]|nr:MAG: histidine phosphatase family protein [Gammaproteobacteria bacterium]